MKKIYLLFCMLVGGTAAFAQTISNGDMELWRSGTAGTTSTSPIEAPNGWYGGDSLFIGIGRTILVQTLLGTDDSVWRRQVYKETTITHGGAASAKLVTTYQDTSLLPGVISNAKTSVSFTTTPPGLSGISYSGGAPVTLRPKTVSAWVQYEAGIDTSTLATLVDSGALTVQALAHIGTKDSVIGSGLVSIAPGTTWSQITANITYPVDTTDSITLLRITFASSGGGGTKPAYHSTLYVDDVTMTGVAYIHVPPVDHTGVRNTTADNAVTVYPNPANGTLYLNGPKDAGLSCKLTAMNGQVVLSTQLTGNDALNIASLATGTYIYTIADAAGVTVQTGKVEVNN